MAEEATPTPEAPEKPQEPVEEIPQDRPEENVAAEARRRERKARQEADELRKKLEELEDKDRSEVERAQRRAEQAEQRATELESKTKELERGAWLRAAASEANFHDPSDAVTAANLDDIESERDAKDFVKRLADQKKHLVKPKDATPDRDKLGRVLEDGKPVNPQQAAAARAEELNQQEAGAIMDVINTARQQIGKEPITPA